MKTGFLHLVFLCLVAFIVMDDSLAQNSQKKCKVLKEEIGDSYSGNCKKGFAHGEGVAKGIDSYSGNFKMGLPHGYGIYQYSDGAIYDGEWKKGKRNGKGKYQCIVNGKDSVVIGYWKNDKYIGRTKNERGYVISRNSGIPTVSFIRADDGDKIELVFMKKGAKVEPKNLFITISSGYQKKSGTLVHIIDVKFPFEGNVRYKTLNQLRTVEIDCELDFKIEKSGTWKILFKNQ